MNKKYSFPPTMTCNVFNVVTNEMIDTFEYMSMNQLGDWLSLNGYYKNKNVYLKIYTN